jgi:hypothetical protein
MGVTAAAKAASKVAIMKADIARVWIYNRPGDGVGNVGGGRTIVIGWGGW